MIKKIKKSKLKSKIKYNQIGGTASIINLNNENVIEPTIFQSKYGIKAQRYLPEFIIDNVTKYITQHISKRKSRKKDKSSIKDFINNYKIDYKTVDNCNINNLDNCLEHFETPNDFFIRIRKGLPEYNSISKDIVSPVDAYTTVFINELSSKKYWIKGHNYTISNLIDSSENHEHMTTIILRLAPHHYHRFHSPVNGQIISIKTIGNSYYSVNPDIVNSSKNVFNKNIRCIVKIKTITDKIIYMIIIGATCVGSIVFTHKNIINNCLDKTTEENSELYYKYNKNEINESKRCPTDKFFREIYFFNNLDIIQNEELGTFQFGGSTVIILYNSDDYNLYLKNITENSNKNIETELQVGIILCNSIK
jgi:phosphatidylserine decarboxylase